MSTPRIEEYLESIFKLQQDEHPVSISRLAEHMELSAPSVSEMLKRLEQNGLIYHTPEKGVCLSAEGERAAKQVVRRHRLSERLLTDLLGFNWDEVHDEACRLEHAISAELEDKIADSLGNPQTCPHGHPIPSKDGTITEELAYPLSELRPGTKGIVVKISEENPQMLKYLTTLGLLPQIEVVVEEIAPFSGPLLVKVKDCKYALGQEVASKILVRAKESHRKRKRGKG